MSVLIKDFDIPKCCNECEIYSRYRTCCALASNGCVDRYNYDISTIPKWCPLIDLPKGKIISANHLIQRMTEAIYSQPELEDVYKEEIQSMIAWIATEPDVTELERRNID